MKFIHTSDWHIGNNFFNFSKEDNLKLEKARFDVIDSIFQYARQNSIELIISAGDQFDKGEYRSSILLKKLFSIFNNYPEIKIVMITGNHDFISQKTIYNQIDKKEYPANLIFIDDKQILEFKEYNCKIYATSLKEKNSRQNPLDWIPDDKEQNLKIVVGHGSLKIEGKYSPDDFPIDLDLATKKNLDYLALGHWHSFYKQDDRTYYCGVMENLQFKEEGFILVVDLQKDQLPEVEKVKISFYNWDEKKYELNDNNLENFILETKNDANEQKIKSLVIYGFLSFSNLEKLNNFLIECQSLFFKCFIKNEVFLKPEEDEILKVVDQSYIKDIVKKLISMKQTKDLPFQTDEKVPKESIVDKALLSIYDFYKEERK